MVPPGRTLDRPRAVLVCHSPSSFAARNALTTPNRRLPRRSPPVWRREAQGDEGAPAQPQHEIELFYSIQPLALSKDVESE